MTTISPSEPAEKDCGCATRAERLLKRLGWEWTPSINGYTLSTPYRSLLIDREMLRTHHFRLTVRGVIGFLSDGRWF